MLRLEHVALRYGEGPEVLRNVNLTLQRGEFAFVTGPSGAGKTSLLRMLALLHMPSAGRLTMFGEDVAQLRRDRLAAVRRRLGMVFQDVRLIDHLSAFDNVALPLRVAGVEERDLEKPVSEMLAWVGLADRASARPATLSGGEQQRVAIARAFVAGPALLLADEPTGNLDRATGEAVIDYLFEEHARLGSALLLITHDAALAERCERRLDLADGRIVGERRTTATKPVRHARG